jgi:hypothetical protein
MDTQLRAHLICAILQAISDCRLQKHGLADLKFVHGHLKPPSLVRLERIITEMVPPSGQYLRASSCRHLIMWAARIIATGLPARSREIAAMVAMLQGASSREPNDGVFRESLSPEKRTWRLKIDAKERAVA